MLHEVQNNELLLKQDETFPGTTQMVAKLKQKNCEESLAGLSSGTR